MSTNLLKELEKEGWATKPAESKDTEHLKNALESIARDLGQPIATKNGVVEEVSPHHIEDSNPNSLSGKYGLDNFPLHCDTSHWVVPCRYVLLSCKKASDIPVSTKLLDTLNMNLSLSDKQLALSSVFLIKNGRKSFYSSILSSSRDFIRLDPGCMYALDDDGKKAMEVYSYAKQKAKIIEINWQRADILIIDNWRVLHGRGASPKLDCKLLRVHVK